MPGEKPYWIEAKVVEIIDRYEVAYAKVENGNVYHLRPSTPGIDFYQLKKEQHIWLEVTSQLIRVYSARIADDSKFAE